MMVTRLFHSTHFFADRQTDDAFLTYSAPPLITRDSHAGYLTTSSPLITTSTIDDGPSNPSAAENSPVQTDGNEGSTGNRIEEISPGASPTIPASESTHSPVSSGLIERTDTLEPPSTERPGRRQSIGSSIRGKSPAQRLKHAFSPARSHKSPRTSPERAFSGG